MNRLSIFALLVSGTIAPFVHAQHVIAWRGTADAPAVSPEDRQRAYILARQSIEQLELSDLNVAEARLREALTILPGKAVWHFNLACILTGQHKLEPAMDELERATD